jgi:hypothetical protein
MIEVQAKASRAGRFDRADTIDTNDAASMRLKEELVVELVSQVGERSIDRETVRFRHGPDELPVGFEIDDVADLDDDVPALPPHREALEPPGA